MFQDSGSPRFRRTRDGSIDYGYYRARAARLRSAVIRGASKRRVAMRVALYTFAIVLGVIFGARIPLHQPGCGPCAPTDAGMSRIADAGSRTVGRGARAP